MKKIIFTLAVMGMMSGAFAQSKPVWSKNFETKMYNYHYGQPALKLLNDTIQVIGRKNIKEGQRLLVVNYDIHGNTLSSISYGGDSVHKNNIIDYKFDGDNGLYLLHADIIGVNKAKTVLQKYALNGNLLWVQQLQNNADTAFSPVSLVQINDTTLFVTAYKEYNYPFPGDDVINTTRLPRIYAYSTSGNLLWEREFNVDSEINYFGYKNIIIPYNNTALLFAANSTSHNSLVKVGPDKTVTTINDIETVNGNGKVLFTADNHLLISSNLQYRITKIDFNGKKMWSTFYGTFLPSNVTGDEIRAMVQDDAGNIYVTGRHYGKTYGTETYSNADILTLKYDINGKLLWENRYMHDVNNADIANFLTLKNGYVYIGGQSQKQGKGSDYDYLVLKIDSSTGKTTGEYRYDGAAGGEDAVSSLQVFDDGRVALTGLSAIDSAYDWTTQLLSGLTLSVSKIENNRNFEIYPNPVANNGVLTIKNDRFRQYSIVTVNGQVIQNGILMETDINTIQLTGLNPGIYFITLRNNKDITTKKLIIK